MRNRVAGLTSTVAAVCALLGLAGAASAKPIFMPTVKKEFQQQQAARAQASARAINPPAVPCPENGQLYPPPAQWPAGAPYPFSNCGVTELPATSLPWGGNMAYNGGHVQVHPKEYIVYWGWGETGAFPNQSCKPETLSEGSINATLQCDPDGAGKYMADFVHQMGGTGWAKVSTQFYENTGGTQTNISNDKNVLSGIWVDDGDNAAALAGTNSSNPAGSGNTYWDLAEEALRATAHFGLSGSALADANIIIAQPPAYSDPNALSLGYCAFHDFTDPNAPGNSYYDGLKMPDGSAPPYISYTNMPYSLAINLNGVNVCGQDAVNNPSSDPNANLDGFSIVLGHEIEETITDPGGEYLDPKTNVEYGGWYDTVDADENGDKCAWVGENPLTGTGPPEPIPGALGNIQGNAGTPFAVQSLWSNADNQGTGYCAGAGTDSPVPASDYGVSSTDATPSNSAAPSISGTPQAGQTLTASPGGWSNSPSSYAYQWQSCDTSGQSCTDIDGATSPTYTVASGDAGNTLAVVVYAANAAGSGPSATSGPTAVVAAASSGSGTTGQTGQTGATGASGQTGATGTAPTPAPTSAGSPPGTAGPSGAQGGTPPHAKKPAARRPAKRKKAKAKPHHKRKKARRHAAPRRSRRR